MKRAIITGLGCLILLLAGCGGAGATEIWVPDDHTNIQDAVDAASPGNTIIVRDGTYHENVDVNVNHLTIRSENGPGSTTVVGSMPALSAVSTADSNDYGFNGFSDHVFDIAADYVNISGFTVTGATGSSKAGIYINAVNHCNISDNLLTGNNHGIYLKCAGGDTARFNVIVNNTVRQNGDNGIRLQGANCNNNRVKNNDVSANEEGIYIHYADYNNITGNTVLSNTESGVYLTQSAKNNNISCNYIFNNRCGIYFKSRSTENIIECNNIIANGEYNPTSGGYEWQFYNDQEEDVSATNNWWGTADNDEINASIYDWQDNPEKGNVTYLPKSEDGPLPCAPIPEPATLVMVALGLLSLIGLLFRSGAGGR